LFHIGFRVVCEARRSAKSGGVGPSGAEASPTTTKRATPTVVASAQSSSAETNAREDPARTKRIDQRKKTENAYQTSMTPIQRLLFAWDFAQAAQALEPLKFDEADVVERLGVRRDEVKRLIALKARIIQTINSAEPRLKKTALALRGMNGDVTKADEKGMMTTLPTGKTEFFAWGELSEKTRDRLLRLAVAPEKADDCLAAGLLLAACGDEVAAERFYGKAAELGAKVEPHLASFAAAALKHAEELIGKQQFREAVTALEAIQQKYAQTPWLASNRELVEDALTKSKQAAAEAEAEKLYAEAAERFAERDFFDLKPIVERLKKDYARTGPALAPDRKPSLSELQQALTGLGKRHVVRKDGKGDFRTIREAIDAAGVNDLVEIQDSSTYSESVQIPVAKSGLTLRGARGSWPILSSHGLTNGSPALVLVLAPKVTIDRLVLIHATPSTERYLDALPAGVVIANGPFRLRNALIGFDKARPLAFSFPDGCSFLAEIENCVLLSPVLLRTPTNFRNCLFLGSELGTRAATGFQSCTIAAPMKMWNNACLGAVRDSIFAMIEISERSGDGKLDNIERSAIVGAETPPGGQKFFRVVPPFRDPSNLDYRPKPDSACAGKAADGGDLGCRYTPEIAELCRQALELRRRKLMDF